MMPNLRAPLRMMGRRVTVQIIQQQVVDGEAVQQGRDLERASIVLTPMTPQKIAIKPEGQRTWKWWTGTSTKRLKVGWYLKPDKDQGKLYEVMEFADWGQARVFVYEFAESPR